MKVRRLTLERFRGFESLAFVPRGHVVLVGEARAGRSALLAGLRLVLDPASTRARPRHWDIMRPMPVGERETSSFVEVALSDLGAEREQVLDSRLELLDPDTGEIALAGSQTAVFGIRIRYCIRYTFADESTEHWVEFVKNGQRVSRAEREMLRGVFVDEATPLQLRVEGVLRQIANSRDPDALRAALSTFGKEVQAAIQSLVADEAVSDTLSQVAHEGAAVLLGLQEDSFADGISYSADDGSVGGLLRAMRPHLDLGEAGPLPVEYHGSTTAAVLTAAEAAASSSLGDRIAVADDFGDQLDAAGSAYLSRLLRARAGQLWLNTRRAEVVTSFEADEIVRVALSTGVPTVHQLEPESDRHRKTSRRHMSSLLASGLSARSLVFTEGPHDLEGYLAVERILVETHTMLPLSGSSMKMVPVSPTGSDGGKHRMPGLARLARELGFETRAVLDNDRPGDDETLIAELQESCDQVIVLPERTAVERALCARLDPTDLRVALETINEVGQLSLSLDTVSDADLEEVAVRALKMKGGMHRAFVEAIPTGAPPIASAIFKVLRADPTDRLVRLQ